MAETLKAFAAEPYEYADARAVADALGLSEPVAVTLVRRGYRTPEQARAFLEADESHPPAAFGSMEKIVAQVRAAVTAGRRITVHGDFDVDGVCATTLMVSTLRELGADCDWLIPDRIEDGYGLSAANVERLAARGTGLLITVDCGVTAVAEVRLARELGMDVVITDHHQSGDELPDCPILHPQISGYPFEHLCGTAVAWKLASALRDGPEADLDLVALATVADVVPLVGENRALVKRGLAEMRRAQRTGLRALMEASKCEPSRLDEGDLAFRLAPRINAAGRLYRADAGVELLLTEDEKRAQEIAEELGRANSERRAREREVDTAAEAARRELPDQLLAAPALVLAGEDWHPGVVGIVASRLVERHHRPVVVISLDGEGGGRGSGRSIPGFDLHAALEACVEHLESFGGHRAAAGLSLRAENLDAFREAFAAHAASVLSPADLLRTERVDAVVGGVGLGLDLAEELGRLAPFGMGNPGVRLLVPSARVSDVRTMGEGKHARFSLHSGAHRALGVAFGRPSLGVEDEEPVDATVRLEVNHWNGAVEPRVVLRELYPLEEVTSGVGEEAPPLHTCTCEDDEWWRRFESELGRDLEGSAATDARPAGSNRSDRERAAVSGGGSGVARIAELVSSGAGVLAVCADAARRAELAGGATGLARFNGGAGRIACARCGGAALGDAVAKGAGGLALIDYETLERGGEQIAPHFEHVVLIDPPHAEAVAALAARPYASEPGDSAPAGFLHRAWTDAEREFALAVRDERLASRQAIAGVFRALREAGEVTGPGLREALGAAGSRPLPPEAAARCFRVLAELGLVAGDPAGGAGTVGVVSSEGTDLERSAAFRAYRRDHSEAALYLARAQHP
ncbi:MAG TPA: single-stranded-DNA-specific exonuclease RecJ [Solirubrobacterales bacterium]|nr:single-stranded-DNA-specific exonuclease RecJ [Solirubrobacterales bacterium]